MNQNEKYEALKSVFAQSAGSEPVDLTIRGYVRTVSVEDGKRGFYLEFYTPGSKVFSLYDTDIVHVAKPPIVSLQCHDVGTLKRARAILAKEGIITT